MDASALTGYWATYYAPIHQAGGGALDYAGPRLQAETFAHAVRLAGPLDGRRVLDAGCGAGQLARMARLLGASNVTGFDFDPAAIERLRRTAADDAWWSVGDLNAPDTWPKSGPWDVVFAVESLQYAPIASTLAHLWAQVAVGGRLVTVLANADNPLVEEGRRRHGGNYRGVGRTGLGALLRSLSGARLSEVYGLHLGVDQRLAAYDIDLLGELADPPPYRFLAVICR